MPFHAIKSVFNLSYLELSGLLVAEAQYYIERVAKTICLLAQNTFNFSRLKSRILVSI